MSSKNYGVSHADELFLMFKFQQVSSSWLGDLALQTEQDIVVQRKLVKLWTHFAKTGKPTEGERKYYYYEKQENKIIFKENTWPPVTDSAMPKYAIIDADDLRLEYPAEFERKMEMVQSMMRLARLHRGEDADSDSALEKMREEQERLETEEEWERQRLRTLEQASEWRNEMHQSDLEFDDLDFDDDFDNFHDEL